MTKVTVEVTYKFNNNSAIYTKQFTGKTINEAGKVASKFFKAETKDHMASVVLLTTEKI